MNLKSNWLYIHQVSCHFILPQGQCGCTLGLALAMALHVRPYSTFNDVKELQIDHIAGRSLVYSLFKYLNVFF